MLMKNKILQKLMYESSKNASYATTTDVLMRPTTSPNEPLARYMLALIFRLYLYVHFT